MQPSTATLGSDGWQLEPDSAEAYERYLVPALMAAGAERLIALTGPKPGERVLDVGCGTGIVARQAAGLVGARGRVLGVDLNAGMLRVAGRLSASVQPPIEWREGNATRLPAADDAFDVVVSQQMLQFVPEPQTAVREMRRVLAPGGRLAVSVCRAIEYAPGYLPLVDGLRRHAGAEAAAMMRSPFPSWSAAELRELFSAAGLRDIHVHIEVMTVRYPTAAEFLRREAGCSPLAGPIGTMKAESRAALVRELTQALLVRTDDDGLVLPLEVYLINARR